jgi:hypothetical protein
MVDDEGEERREARHLSASTTCKDIINVTSQQVARRDEDARCASSFVLDQRWYSACTAGAAAPDRDADTEDRALRDGTEKESGQ